MKIKTTSAEPEKLSFSVTPQATDVLPMVLIDYLFGLVKADQNISGCRHVFRLVKDQLGGENIQNIFHIGENDAIAIHRVFGYKPVVAEIVVICDETSYYMSLSNNVLVTDCSSGFCSELSTSFLPATACNMCY